MRIDRCRAFLAAFLLSLGLQAGVKTTRLLTEGQVTPLSIESEHPRLSWMLESDEQGVMQSGYHILVASSLEKLAAGEGDLWDSGRVDSDQSLYVPYGGKELKSNQRCFWKVKVYTANGETEWSEPASWGMGLLGESHWSGRWIGWDAPFAWDKEVTHSRLSARYLRTEFKAKGGIKRATVHISGLGLYELFVNGKQVGDQVMAPAPTDYRRTVLYNSFDVTSMLTTDNAIGVVLGNGRFYTMRQNYKPYKIVQFGYPKMRLNLIIEYNDGTRQVVSSNEKDWKLTGDGPIRSNNEYDGEEYDARKELGAWTTVGYDDSNWLTAQRVSLPYGSLHGAQSPNMKVMGEVKAVSIKQYGNRYIVDFGQNMAGWVRMKVRTGAAGDTIRMRYSELLTADGKELNVAGFRDAQSTDTYICNGKEQGREWSARFSTHGFRYIEVTGYKNPQLSDFTAELIYDEMENTGTFECSNPLFNQIFHNAWWGIASNYKGMPLDCPQRNERQPWLGDRTMTAWSECFLFGNRQLYAKWMKDICDSQREDGSLPDMSPAYYNYYTDDITWPVALPVICDMLYEQYGDVQPIKDSYKTLVKWMAYMKKEYKNDKNLITKFKFGDWCMPPESLELIHAQDPARQTDKGLIVTAYYYKTLNLMAKFARLLGHEAEAKSYEAEATGVLTAFNDTYLTIKKGTSPAPGHWLYPDSIFYGNNTVTANILPLAFGMIPAEYQHEVEKNIIAKINATKEHVSWGLIGGSWIMRELTRMGRGDVAYVINNQKTYPSFGYMIEQGATTIWELWNGDKASPKMNSANHVMQLGDLLAWYYKDLAGIAPGKPGYKEILMRPDFSIEELDYVNASYMTPYGKVTSNWKKTLMLLDWDIAVPCNTTALVYLPTLDEQALNQPNVTFVRREGDNTVWRLAPGTYHLTVNIDPSRGKDKQGIIEEQFLYINAPFPQAHSVSIAETPKGDLVATYFGGTKERNPDVCIWVSRKPKGATEWEAPVQVADGIISATERKACWNPVLLQIPGKKGELLLFYKVGKSVADWKAYILRSEDGGRTWSKPEAMPDGFLGPSKNKPEYVDGRIICPSSTEGNGWKIHFEISDDNGHTWRKVGPVEAELSVPTQFRKKGAANTDDMEAGEAIKGEGAKPIYCIQPAILRHKDGRLQVVCRTRNAKVATSWSSDNGDTWSKVTLLDIENNNSGLDAVTLKDGRHVLVYNNFETIPGTPKGARTPLSVAISDDGIHWKHIITLEDSPVSQYSYPAVIQGKDSKVHVAYTWRRQRIKYVELSL